MNNPAKTQDLATALKNSYAFKILILLILVITKKALYSTHVTFLYRQLKIRSKSPLRRTLNSFYVTKAMTKTQTQKLKCTLE